MTIMFGVLKVLRVAVASAAVILLTACGGGSTGGSSSVTTYTVSASAGTGGSISPSSATVNAGGTTTFTVTPSSGYAVSSVAGCGGALAGSTYATGAITANCTVTASFVAQYTVTAKAGNYGSISPSSTIVNAGQTTTFTLTPSSRYAVSGVTGCGGTLSGNTYTTGAIFGACTVTASFSAAFTWVSGSATEGMNGVYGTQGVAALGNQPGARGSAATWTDAGGNLWLFGGIGLDATGGNGDLNDLWEYSPASGQWTWAGGSSAIHAKGVYGSRGVAAATNVPGARDSAATWEDAAGNVWVFGGSGFDSTGAYGNLNDLWKYSPASGEWTWVGGSNTVNANPVYGSLDVPASSNMPGARAYAVSWIDANGDLWLFGGIGLAPAPPAPSDLSYLNDLWEYSPASGEWTWVGGSDIVRAPGDYGTEGAAASANVPGARANAVSWVDTGGDLWLLGGVGYDSADTLGRLNDLWKYSPASGEWTWVNGSSVTGSIKGIYGTQGIAAAANAPGVRFSAISWLDPGGNFWLFGGEGLDAAGTSGHLSDLWQFSPASGEWTWFGGPDTANTKGVYGTKGVAQMTNAPGGRNTEISWTDAGGNLWLFGGYGLDSTGAPGELNDLWEYPTR